MGRYKVSCVPGGHTTDKAARKAWGCDAPALAPVFPDPLTGKWESLHFDLRRCPACQVGHEWVDLVRTWGVFGGGDNLGPMPMSGGWLDQMQWFADAHGVLSAERSKYLESRRKDAEARR